MLVKPTTGLRQGDPLSPNRFSLLLDKYLAATDTNITFSSGDICLDAMAFAEELPVFASTRRGLQERLDEFAASLELRHFLSMSRSPSPWCCNPPEERISRR